MTQEVGFLARADTRAGMTTAAALVLSGSRTLTLASRFLRNIPQEPRRLPSPAFSGERFACAGEGQRTLTLAPSGILGTGSVILRAGEGRMSRGRREAHSVAARE